MQIVLFSAWIHTSVTSSITTPETFNAPGASLCKSKRSMMAPSREVGPYSCLPDKPFTSQSVRSFQKWQKLRRDLWKLSCPYHLLKQSHLELDGQDVSRQLLSISREPEVFAWEWSRELGTQDTSLGAAPLPLLQPGQFLTVSRGAAPACSPPSLLGSYSHGNFWVVSPTGALAALSDQRAPWSLVPTGHHICCVRHQLRLLQK